MSKQLNYNKAIYMLSTEIIKECTPPYFMI